MGQSKKHIDEELVASARIALDSIKDHVVALRLQAIISSLSHEIQLVAEIFGISRGTVGRWIRSFKESGIEGLIDKPKGHNPSKLDSSRKETISGWIEKGVDPQGRPIHWTIEKLRVTIEDEFGIAVGKTPLWITMRSFGFGMKTPRPRHEKADPVEQKQFKKNSGA